VEGKIKDVGEYARGGREMSVILKNKRGCSYTRKRKEERRVSRKREKEGNEGNVKEAEEEK
jgi:hypothetical protein